MVIEIDGGYHDAVGEANLKREAVLREKGWRIIRLTDKEVESDLEAVGQAIASQLGLENEFKRRDGRGEGIMHENAPEGPKELF